MLKWLSNIFVSDAPTSDSAGRFYSDLSTPSHFQPLDHQDKDDHGSDGSEDESELIEDQEILSLIGKSRVQPPVINLIGSESDEEPNSPQILRSEEESGSSEESASESELVSESDSEKSGSETPEISGEEFYIAFDKPSVADQMRMYESQKKLSILPKHKITRDEVNALYAKVANGPSYDTEGKSSQQSATRLLAPYFEKEKRRLQSAWLSDDIVDTYFNFLQAKNPHTTYISSNYREKIIKEIDKKSWRLYEKLKKAKVIFWLIIEKDHFYLLVIVKNRNKVNLYCMDGFNSKNNHTSYFQWGEKLMRALHKRSKLQFSKISCHVPQQNNDDDCGVAICYFGKRFAETPIKDIANMIKTYETGAPCSYRAFRLEIAESISALNSKKESEDLTSQNFEKRKKRRVKRR